MSPRRAARVCPVSGCPNLVRGSVRYCEEHLSERQRNESKARRAAGTAAQYGPEWTKRSAAYLAEHPWCTWPGCAKRSEISHHIIEKEKGGSDADENLRAMCRSCHSGLHARLHGGIGRNRDRAE